MIAKQTLEYPRNIRTVTLKPKACGVLISGVTFCAFPNMTEKAASSATVTATTNQVPMLLLL